MLARSPRRQASCWYDPAMPVTAVVARSLNGGQLVILAAKFHWQMAGDLKIPLILNIRMIAAAPGWCGRWAWWCTLIGFGRGAEPA